MKFPGALMNRMLVLAAVVLAGVGMAAQRQAFQTISIKRNVSGISSGGGAYIVDGRLQMTDVSVSALIQTAYWNGVDLAPSQVVEGPDWLERETFDVTATVGPDLQGKRTAQLIGTRRLLLQSMLEDRFKLKVHRETRDLPRYVLKVSAPGQLGPRLSRPSADCAGAATPACTVRVLPGHFSMGNAPLVAFIQYVARNILRTVVVDRTDLAGMFALTFDWPATQGAPQSAVIASALRDQLGLELTLEHGPTDVVVVDHVERPRNQ